MARSKISKPCSISECANPYFSTGLCRKHYNQKHHQKRRSNPEYIQAQKKYQHSWYIKNRERLGFKERQPPKSKEYYAAYKKAWAQKNRERINARHRDWERGWYAKNTTKALLKVHARQTKTKLKIDPEEIYNWFTKICGICDLIIEDCFDIDHIIPLSRGGVHEASNLQLAHRFCNRSKSNKLPEEYKKEKAPEGA